MRAYHLSDIKGSCHADHSESRCRTQSHINKNKIEADNKINYRFSFKMQDFPVLYISAENCCHLGEGYMVSLETQGSWVRHSEVQEYRQRLDHHTAQNRSAKLTVTEWIATLLVPHPYYAVVSENRKKTSSITFRTDPHRRYSYKLLKKVAKPANVHQLPPGNADWPHIWRSA